MRRALASWLLLIFGVSVLLVVGVAAFPLAYGTGDPANFADAVGSFCHVTASFVGGAVLDLDWWITGGLFAAAFVTQQRRRRAISSRTP